jgi:hypothetical protein
MIVIEVKNLSSEDEASEQSLTGPNYQVRIKPAGKEKTTKSRGKGHEKINQELKLYVDLYMVANVY